ncbi:MAG: hypothetical protein AAGG11_14055 [Pseudomonadota bacterium]
MTISTIAKLGTAALLIGGTMTATAGTASFAESRGYARCVQLIAEDSRGLVADRDYQIQKSAEGQEYFINASRWESGKRADVRINCETTRNGRRMVSLNVEPGSYIDGMDIAGN